MNKDTVVVGVGNTIRGDDAIGILAVRFLREAASPAQHDRMDFKEAEDAAMNTLERIQGYRRARIIDAIRTPGGTPGDIYQLRVEDLPGGYDPHSFHQMGLGGMIRLAAGLGLKVPADILLYAIEIQSADLFTTTVNPGVARSIPILVELLLGDGDTERR